MSSSTSRSPFAVAHRHLVAAGLTVVALALPPAVLAAPRPGPAPVRPVAGAEDSLRASEKETLSALSQAGGVRVDAHPGVAPLPSGNPANLCFPPGPTAVTSMAPNDDGSSGLMTLPFDFCLYGSSYRDFYINNNGNISFVTPYSVYSPIGFPSASYIMVAPFWADVDTRGTGRVKHETFGSNKFVVTWDNVGYYNSQVDKVNTFQLAISDGTDPAMGLGNNVCFCYDDMAWTTGSASGGSGGFGGSAATVGVNRGNGVDYYQVGRFDHAGTDYDGPYGANDGVSWLDTQRICFNICEFNPPSCSIAPVAESQCRSVVIDGAVVADPDDALVDWAWSGAGLTFSPASGTADTTAGGIVTPTTATLDPPALPCGVTFTATLTVNDRRGGISTCDVPLTFHDTTAPSLTLPGGGAPQRCLWPPNHRMECFDIGSLGIVASDNCDGPVTWEILGIASTQCDDAPCADHPGENGDGDTTDDVVLAEDMRSFCVRAERAGTDPAGRYYDVLVVATDECGNSSAPAPASRVHVPHDQSPPRARLPLTHAAHLVTTPTLRRRRFPCHDADTGSAGGPPAPVAQPQARAPPAATVSTLQPAPK